MHSLRLFPWRSLCQWQCMHHNLWNLVMNTHFKLVFSLQMCVLGFVWACVRWRHTSLPFWPPGSADVYVHLVQPRSHVLPRWRHAGERHLFHCTFLCTRYYFYLLLSHLLCQSRKPSPSSHFTQTVVFFQSLFKITHSCGCMGCFYKYKVWCVSLLRQLHGYVLYIVNMLCSRWVVSWDPCY